MKVQSYFGSCDGSAGVLRGDYLLVANDEDNKLRWYRLGEPKKHGHFDLAGFLEVEDDHPETDIEGAAVAVDGVVYWIGSHGRNKNAKPRPNRHRFFSTVVTASAAGLVIKPFGQPYKKLLKYLASPLEKAGIKLEEAEAKAPEEPGGLSIEGLTAWRDALLIGFRSPLAGTSAISIPLWNARGVVSDAETPRLGNPLLLDLGGRGIRAMEPIATGLLIIAGATDDSGDFALFHWSGEAQDPPARIDVAFGSLRPEDVLLRSGRGTLLFLSDDGGMNHGGSECKDLPEAQKTFRVLEGGFSIVAVNPDHLETAVVGGGGKGMVSDIVLTALP